MDAVHSTQPDQPSKPEYVSTTVRIDPELRKRMKIHAIARGETFTALLHRYLEDGLGRDVKAA